MFVTVYFYWSLGHNAASGLSWLHGALALFQLVQLCELPLYSIVRRDIDRISRHQTRQHHDNTAAFVAASLLQVKKWQWRVLEFLGSAVQLSAAPGFAYFYVYSQYGSYASGKAAPVLVQMAEERKFHTANSVPVFESTETPQEIAPQWQGQITDHYWHINFQLNNWQGHLHLAGLFICAIILLRTICSIFWICSVLMYVEIVML